MEIAIDTPIDINLEKGWKITEKHETNQNSMKYTTMIVYIHIDIDSALGLLQKNAVIFVQNFLLLLLGAGKRRFF